MSDLLESSLAVLALVSHPPVVALAGPVGAGSRKAAFLTGLEGRGGFAAQHQTQRQADSQVSPPHAPPARGDAHRAIHDGRTAGLCCSGGCREPAELLLCHHTQVAHPRCRKTANSPPSEHAELHLLKKNKQTNMWVKTKANKLS